MTCVTRVVRPFLRTPLLEEWRSADTPQHTWGDVLLNSLDLITITVPPALPLVLTIGTPRHLFLCPFANACARSRVCG
jgi:magnesium-transporting ATPase (P-type)